MRKAFNSVCRDLLMIKLDEMGIAEKTNKWIENILSNREQRVFLAGAISSPVKIESGIFQGAVLSGLLFSSSKVF